MLADELVLRAAPAIARAARGQFPRSTADQDDLMQMASVQMWQEVFDTRGSQEFWEVFFLRMVLLVCSAFFSSPGVARSAIPDSFLRPFTSKTGTSASASFANSSGSRFWKAVSRAAIVSVPPFGLPPHTPHSGSLHFTSPVHG